MQIAFALRGAREKSGIAAVEGGLAEQDGELHAGGPCSFGCDEPAARVLVTVMKFDPLRRSAALLRCSDRALRVLDEDLFLDCVSFDAAHAPQGISTMDWGIASCCREEVPDVMYSRGSRGAGAVLVLLGEDPVDVANNIIICSNRL